MAYLLNRINEQLAKAWLQPRTNQARAWLRAKIDDLKPSRQALLRDKGRTRDSTIIGRMYFFYYDPKMKESLPYYDRFPLVIPIEQYQDGFLGLNLHYIHPKQRLLLLDELSEFANNSKYDSSTKLRLSYDLLRRTGAAYQATPCIKRYLFTHVESRFLEITADEWDLACLLPLENFQKASASKVYSESRKQF
jgi:hypothetical protein